MTEKKTLLIVDDDEAFLEIFSLTPEAQQYQIIKTTSAINALKILETNLVDLLISDIQMPDMTGIELFEKVQETFPEVPVILMTAFGSIEMAIDAVKHGAFHYFEKPIQNRFMLFWTTVREAINKGEMLRDMAWFERERALSPSSTTPLVGASQAIRKVLHQISEVADLGLSVLITGETGTGKELVARAIHDQGARRMSPYVAVSCAEFASGLLEVELFGHEKGAFPDAVSQKKGLFEIANNGTLLLDEISEASLSLQAKLLRVLETRTIKRVGGFRPTSSDFRILAATNRNLSGEVTAGRFRQDLFYRLNVYTINLPPLRERREDIPLIADFYLNRFNKNYCRDIDGYAANAMQALFDYDWPGNVRELVNIIERAVITCTANKITLDCLPFGSEKPHASSDLNLTKMEQHYIKRAMQRTGNNKSKAADLLGISRQTLMKKIKELIETGSDGNIDSHDVV